MKVSQNTSPIQMDAYLKQIQKNRRGNQGTASAESVQTGMGDTVQLSQRAKEIQQTAHAVGQTEEIRDEKVQQVKMDIEKGNYKVNAGQVATDMLREAFENNKIMKRIDTRA